MTRLDHLLSEQQFLHAWFNAYITVARRVGSRKKMRAKWSKMGTQASPQRVQARRAVKPGKERISVVHYLVRPINFPCFQQHSIYGGTQFDLYTHCFRFFSVNSSNSLLLLILSHFLSPPSLTLLSLFPSPLGMKSILVLAAVLVVFLQTALASIYSQLQFMKIESPKDGQDIRAGDYLTVKYVMQPLIKSTYTIIIHNDAYTCA